MTNQFKLRTGAALHFIIAIGHLVCLLFLDLAFEAYGIKETMQKMVMGNEWMLYAITVALAVAFGVAGFYGLSASRDIRRLPFTRLVCAAVVMLFSARSILGFGTCIADFRWLQFISSLIPAFVAYCYWPGMKNIHS